MSCLPVPITATAAPNSTITITAPPHTHHLPNPFRDNDHDHHHHHHHHHILSRHQLTMPESDVEMPTEAEGGHVGGWEATRRWFDFSRRDGNEGMTAMMDLLPDFRDLSERPEVCRPHRSKGGSSAFHLVGERRRVGMPLLVFSWTGAAHVFAKPRGTRGAPEDCKRYVARLF